LLLAEVDIVIETAKVRIIS